MESQQYIAEIENYTQGRFLINTDNDWIKSILDISFGNLSDKSAIQLKRITSTSDTWRLFLVVVVDNKNDYNNAISWAASVREGIIRSRNL